MNRRYDPELEDILPDPELLHIASMLSSAHTPDPPLDEAFKSGLRRELMARAWQAAERRGSFWRRLAAPPRMAWVGAVALVALIALVVLQTQQPGSGDIQIASPQSGGTQVQLQQPILVSFNQPMDHPSTEQAVQIVPATAVQFRWVGDTQLYVQPTSGDLAPNTQYQVTIGPSARTRDGKPLSTPRQFTFVTQPTTPGVPVTPRPTPGGTQLTGEHQVASTGVVSVAPQWSPDSSTVYFISGGALMSVPAAGGQPQTLVPDGVSVLAIAPAGDRIAFIRGGHVLVMTPAVNGTIDVGASSATTVTWVNDRIFWATPEGVFAAGPGLQLGSGSKVISNPNPSSTIVSIAPDGGHAVLATGRRALAILDLSSGGTVQLGPLGGTNFQGWSPDGTRLIHDGVVVDMRGQVVGRLPQGDTSWSTQGQILVGGASSLAEVKPDGSGQVQLASGNQYQLPSWAPDGATIAFVRRGGVWVATVATTTHPQPRSIDDAAAVVRAFMDARLAGDAGKANSFLDDNGRAAYGNGGPALIPGTELGFRRYFILTAQVDPSSPNTVRFIVRLLYGRGGPIERALSEETLILRRASESDPFLIDRVIAGTSRDLGRGPVVVAVRITPTQVAVIFNSDLQPSTISAVTIQDANGAALSANVSYADRTVTLTGLQLTAGASYRLVVLPTVLDIGNSKAAQEYDLDFIGPGVDSTSTAIVIPDAAAGG